MKVRHTTFSLRLHGCDAVTMRSELCRYIFGFFFPYSTFASALSIRKPAEQINVAHEDAIPSNRGTCLACLSSVLSHASRCFEHMSTAILLDGFIASVR